jgi:hypothetical protein
MTDTTRQDDRPLPTVRRASPFENMIGEIEQKARELELEDWGGDDRSRRAALNEVKNVLKIVQGYEGALDTSDRCMDDKPHTHPKPWQANSNTCTVCGAIRA